MDILSTDKIEQVFNESAEVQQAYDVICYRSNLELWMLLSILSSPTSMVFRVTQLSNSFPLERRMPALLLSTMVDVQAVISLIGHWRSQQRMYLLQKSSRYSYCMDCLQETGGVLGGCILKVSRDITIIVSLDSTTQIASQTDARGFTVQSLVLYDHEEHS